MNPDFLELASDDFLAATVTKGRPGRRMLAWGEKDGGLKAEEIRQVVGYIRQSSGVQMRPDALPRRWVQGDLASGQRLYTASCAGCHGVRGQGGEGPALNNKTLLESATDTYLVETVSRGRRGTAMQGFLTPSTVRATLTKEEIESVIAFIRSWEGRK